MNLMKLAEVFLKPVTDMVDSLHTSEEEKQLLKNTITQSFMDYDRTVIEAKSEIIKSEAQSEHWLTSAWRPITALVFTAIVANNYIIAPYTSALFGVKIMLEIPPEMWDLLKLMIGGYVASRGVEKGIGMWKGSR